MHFYLLFDEIHNHNTFFSHFLLLKTKATLCLAVHVVECQYWIDVFQQITMNTFSLVYFTNRQLSTDENFTQIQIFIHWNTDLIWASKFSAYIFVNKTELWFQFNFTFIHIDFNLKHWAFDETVAIYFPNIWNTNVILYV